MKHPELSKRFAALITMIFCMVIVQAREISGIVVDENGDPLAGATVKEIPSVKGASVHAVAVDLQGHFSLQVGRETRQIAVSFVGYKPMTVTLTNENSYKIEMTPTADVLDEVVVTGYQTLSKERTTGSFAKINRKELDSQRITSVGDMLEGHVAGYTDGKIRGITSMQGITTPLYVIDGFPVERTTVTYAGGGFEEQVPDINVDDIESITVLKDAAATSIYGARAANGVVVITTKKADKGKVRVSGSATFSIQPYKRVNTFTMDSRELIDQTRDWISQVPGFNGEGAEEYAKSMLANSSNLAPHIRAVYERYAGLMTQQQLDSRLDNWSKQGYRWYDETDAIDKRDATTQRYSLSVASSSERNNLVATLSYNRTNEFSRYSFNEGVDISLRNTVNMTSWATLDLGASIIYNNSSSSPYTLSTPGFSVAPYMSFYNEDGSYIKGSQEEMLSASRLNAIKAYGLYNEDIDPMDELGRNKTIANDLVTRAYARLNFKITDWLRFTPQFQYEWGNFQTRYRQEKETYAVRSKINDFASLNNGTTVFNLPYGDIYQKGQNNQTSYNLRMQLDFNRTFAGIHDVTAIAGMEMRHAKTRAEYNTLYGYDDQLNTFATVDQTAIQSFSGAIFSRPWISSYDFASIRELTNRFISFYANAAYAYDGKYMLNASIRTDRTNLFGTSGKYQGKPIWSAGAAWRIDREEFLRTDWINMLKLRASYGIGGNIAKDTWPYMVAYYGTNVHPGVGGIQGSISSRPNPELRWEKTTTFNIGVDFGMLDNRLNGSVEFYNKKGTDLLASSNGISVEGQGFSTTTINNGEMTNRGFELNVSGRIIRNRDWDWGIGGIVAYNHSNVDYVNVEAPVGFLQIDQPAAFPRVGNPFTAMYGYKFEGLDENGLPVITGADGQPIANSYSTTLDDIIYLGSYTPTYSGSVSTDLRWKDFSLSALLLFEGGHKVRTGYYTYDDQWKKPGDEAHTIVPRYLAAENNDLYCDWDLYGKSSAVVEDAANIRLRNISLAYNLPKEICSKFFAQETRIMFGIENIATFAKSKSVKYYLGGYNRPNYVISLNLNF